MDLNDEKLVKKGIPVAPHMVAEHAAAMSFAPGQIIAERYRILYFLGQGANGRVFAVEQIFLHKKSALKVLNMSAPSDAAIRRFQKEGLATSKLEHENIAKAVDFGVMADSTPFLVMEFLEGITLSEHLKSSGTVSTESALKIFIPLCSALAYAHEIGVVHRDIKPGNIILTAGKPGTDQVIPKLVDFGIAKIEGDGQALTKTGEVFGTPLYMSPEQCNGENIDQRSDIYSLGCVLYETLTGAPPFRGDTALSTMMQHRTQSAAPLREASIGLRFPRELENIVAKMMAKEPEKRYSDCAEIERDLVALDNGKVVKCEVPGPDHVKLKTRGYKPLAMGIAGALAIGGILAISFFLAPARIASPVVAPITNPTPFDTHPSADESQALDENQTPDEHSFRIPGKPDFDIRVPFDMGWLCWYGSNGALVTHEAFHKFSVPNSAKLILRLSPTVMIDHSRYLNGFADGDFQGVYINTNQTVLGGRHDQSINDVLKELKSFDSLRILMVKGALGKISPDGMKAVGALANLGWLTVEDSVDHGSALAALPNLRNLKVLGANHVDRATPFLRVLAQGCKLRSLSLQRCHLTKEDVSLICRLPVTTLNLRDNFRQDELELAVGALGERLPKLSRLCLTAVRLTPALITKLARFKHLKELVLTDTQAAPESVKRLKDDLAHGCVLITPPDDHEVMNDWFDPLKTDPATDGIW